MIISTSSSLATLSLPHQHSFSDWDLVSTHRLATSSTSSLTSELPHNHKFSNSYWRCNKGLSLLPSSPYIACYLKGPLTLILYMRLMHIKLRMHTYTIQHEVSNEETPSRCHNSTKNVKCKNPSISSDRPSFLA